MDTIQAVLAIVLIDLTLSGDNALVIGMAARNLPPKQRRQAIILGGAGAVVLRIIAAAAVTLLLAIPYLQAAAAIVLLVIAYRLVRQGESEGKKVRAAGGLGSAIVTILAADAAMSLENILGVGAAADGNVPLLVFGLALSIPIVLFGSAMVVGLLQKYPQAIWLGAIALLWTAAEMLLDEPSLPLRAAIPWSAELVLTAVFLGLLVATKGALRTRALRTRQGAAVD
jgi:YjbE family integral membrane protein